MDRVIDPKTGQEYALIGGQWRPVATAQATKPEQKPEALASGPIEAALVGAGDVFNTIGMNLRGVRAQLQGNQGALDEIQAQRDEANALRERLQAESPKAAMFGAMLPSLATIPLGMGIGGAANTGGRLMAEQLATNAVTSGLQSPSGNVAQDAGIGLALGAGGMLAANIGARVWAGKRALEQARQIGSPMMGRLSPAEQDLVEGAKRAGMAITPGQAAGSNQMRQLEASLSSNPATSRVFQEMEQHNVQQLDTLAARAMGVRDAIDVGPSTRAVAESQLAKKFEDVGKAIGPVETAGLRKSIGELAKEESTALLPRTELDSLLARFERGTGARAMADAGAATDQVSGVALMRERSRIARQMRDAFARNDSSAGELYGNVLEAIDESAKKAAIRSAKGDPTAGEALARSYDTARSEWAVLRAMDRGGASIDGHVMPGQAARLMKSSDKTGFWGRADDVGNTLARKGGAQLGHDPIGDFYDALRWRASQMGRPIVGDSGTATRMYTGQVLQGASAMQLAAAAAKRLTLDPVVRGYSSMSPEAASTMFAVTQAMKGVPLGAGAELGAGAARVFGSQ